eukprot:69769-Pelagomonas_calceolata.AAC.1
MAFWERTHKASGSFEANCTFLVVEGACAGMFQKALLMPLFGKERKGKGYIAVPAYKGSLAEA